MKKFTTILTSLFVFSLFLIPTVNAESSMEKEKSKFPEKERMEKAAEKKEEAMEKKEEMMEKREEQMEKRCQNIETRLDNRLKNFGGNKDTHVEIYNRIKDKLTSIVVALDERGLDVSKLESDIEIFNSMVLDYADSYSVVVTTLENANGLECGSSDGEFKEFMQTAKDQLALSKDKRGELKEYYRTVIREDIKDLREQASSSKGDN